MRVATAMVGLNLALNWCLIWTLREAGLAWSTAISAMVQSVVLSLLCRQITAGPILDADLRRGVLRVCLAAAAMGAGVYAARRLLPPPGSWTAHLVSLLALCASGGVLYLLAATLLRCHELGWLLRRR